MMQRMRPSIETFEPVLAIALIPLASFVCLWGGRWMQRRLEVPLGLRFKVMVWTLCAYFPLGLLGAPLPDWLAGRLVPSLRLGLLAVAIFSGALLLVSLIRRYFWNGWFQRIQGARAPRFVSDVGSALIVGGSLVFIAQGVFGLQVMDLKLGSTVSVAVLGFACQDLLGNLLSGIALQIASPFKPGDWLQLDGRRLQVLEVNWRATRLRSPDNVLVEVPNKTVAGGTIVNLSAPTQERASSVLVGLEYSAAPEAAKACLKASAERTKGVLSDPPPRVLLKDFGELAVQYEVSFWVANEESLADASDALRTHIWHDLQEAGLKMPSPTRTVRLLPGDGISMSKGTVG